MIFFVPAYDEATRGNIAVARHLPEVIEELRLFEDEASLALIDVMEAHPRRPLLAMSHGTHSCLQGQYGQPVLDVSCARSAQMSARIMFVFACHTATELGCIASQHGAIWWGYTGSISSPPGRPETLSILAGVFEYVRSNFVKATDAASQARFLRELKSCSDAAVEQLDELYGEGAPVEVDAYLCMLHVWERLRGWIAGSAVPLQHPDSRPPLLF